MALSPMNTPTRPVTLAGIDRNSEMGLLPREIEFGEILKKFSVEEALRIAYIPIVLSKAAFEYAKFAVRLCVEKKLPYRKQTRIIREAIDEYEQGLMGTIRTEVRTRLESQVEFFFDQADDDVEKLWYVIRLELIKRYPDMPQIDLLTNIYVCVSMLDYVRKFEETTNYTIQSRTHMPYANYINKQCIDIRNAYLSIADNYKIARTDIIQLAIRIIALKVDKIAVTLPDGESTDEDNH